MIKGIVDNNCPFYELFHISEEKKFIEEKKQCALQEKGCSCLMETPSWQECPFNSKINSQLIDNFIREYIVEIDNFKESFPFSTWFNLIMIEPIDRIS